MGGESAAVRSGHPALTGHDPSDGKPIQISGNLVGELMVGSGADDGTITYNAAGLVATLVQNFTRRGAVKTKTWQFTYDASNLLTGYTTTIT